MEPKWPGNPFQEQNGATYLIRGNQAWFVLRRGAAGCLH